MEFDHLHFEQRSGYKDTRFHLNPLPYINGWLYLLVVMHGGADQDPEGKEGRAHFREHIGDRGIQNYPDPKSVKEAKESCFSDQFNAATHFNGIKFGGPVFKANVQRALSFLRNFIFFPLISKEGVEKERGVIEVELRQEIGNSLNEKITRSIRRNIYGDNPIGNMLSYAGSLDSIAQIGAEDLLAASQNFHLGNVEILISGDADEKEALDWSTILSDGVPRKDRIEKTPVRKEGWPAPKTPERRISIRKEFGPKIPINYTAQVCAQRPLPKKKNVDLFLVGAMLRNIVLEIARSQLGTSYSVRAINQIYWDHWFLGFKVKSHPDHALKIYDMIKDALQKFERKNFYLDLFHRQKQIHYNGKRMWSHDPRHICEHAFRNLILEGSIPDLGEILSGIQSLKYQDVQELMVEEFLPFVHWSIIEP